MKINISLFISILFLFSCNDKTFDNEEDLLTYLHDESNGYVQSKIVNGVNFSLMYRPTDLLVKQEIGEEEATKERIKELNAKYKKYMYFNLSMSKNNQELLTVAPKNKNEFGAMVNQLAFGMDNKVHLFTQSKDTLELLDFLYPRMYGMSKSTAIMFVYPREENKLKENYLNFTIEDLGLYTGEVKFKIDSNIINNEPKILFKAK